MSKTTTMGHDQSCSYFRQLADGRWSAHNFSDVYVSVEKFDRGVQPDRFKYLECVKASEAEAKEHWDILKAEGYFKNNEDDVLKEMAVFFGELY